MEMANKVYDRFIAGFGLSFAVTSFLSALLVIVKDLIAPVKDWMKAATGHHWVTHGVIILALFVVLGFVLSSTNLTEKWKFDANKTLITVITGTVIGTLMIAGLYLFYR